MKANRVRVPTLLQIWEEHTRFEQMSINDIAHLWGVFGTELREEIDWQEGGDNDSE